MKGSAANKTEWDGQIYPTLLVTSLPRTNQSEKHSVSFIWNQTSIKYKRLVYNSTIFKLTGLFILYFFIQNVYADKNLFKKKG